MSLELREFHIVNRIERYLEKCQCHIDAPMCKTCQIFADTLVRLDEVHE